MPYLEGQLRGRWLFRRGRGLFQLWRLALNHSCKKQVSSTVLYCQVVLIISRHRAKVIRRRDLDRTCAGVLCLCGCRGPNKLSAGTALQPPTFRHRVTHACFSCFPGSLPPPLFTLLLHPSILSKFQTIVDPLGFKGLYKEPFLTTARVLNKHILS